MAILLNGEYRHENGDEYEAGLWQYYVAARYGDCCDTTCARLAMMRCYCLRCASLFYVVWLTLLAGAAFGLRLSLTRYTENMFIYHSIGATSQRRRREGIAVVVSQHHVGDDEESG